MTEFNRPLSLRTVASTTMLMGKPSTKKQDVTLALSIEDLEGLMVGLPVV